MKKIYLTLLAVLATMFYACETEQGQNEEEFVTIAALEVCHHAGVLTGCCSLRNECYTMVRGFNGYCFGKLADVAGIDHNTIDAAGRCSHDFAFIPAMSLNNRQIAIFAAHGVCIAIVYG